MVQEDYLNGNPMSGTDSINTSGLLRGGPMTYDIINGGTSTSGGTGIDTPEPYDPGIEVVPVTSGSPGINGGTMSSGGTTTSGGTTVTFTGLGSNLSFADGSFVTGNSQMFSGSKQFVESDQTLAFDNFTGDFSANVNNGFTGAKVALGGIDTWKVEVASADAELAIGDAKNNFSGDTLSITLAENAAPDSTEWDVIAGSAISLKGWEQFGSVSIDGASAAFTDGEWRTVAYRLFRYDDTLKLAALP